MSFLPQFWRLLTIDQSGRLLHNIFLRLFANAPPISFHDQERVSITQTQQTTAQRLGSITHYTEVLDLTPLQARLSANTNYLMDVV